MSGLSSSAASPAPSCSLHGLTPAAHGGVGDWKQGAGAAVCLFASPANIARRLLLHMHVLHHPIGSKHQHVLLKGKGASPHLSGGGGVDKCAALFEDDPRCSVLPAPSGLSCWPPSRLQGPPGGVPSASVPGPRRWRVSWGWVVCLPTHMHTCTYALTRLACAHTFAWAWAKWLVTVTVFVSYVLAPDAQLATCVMFTSGTPLHPHTSAFKPIDRLVRHQHCPGLCFSNPSLELPPQHGVTLRSVLTDTCCQMRCPQPTATNAPHYSTPHHVTQPPTRSPCRPSSSWARRSSARCSWRWSCPVNIWRGGRTCPLPFCTARPRT